MGERTAYYAPKEQDTWIGRAEEIADLFWEKGVFLASEDGHIYSRLRDYNESGAQPPESEHQFSFAEMGIADERVVIPVPYNVYDAQCPKCGAEVWEQFADAMANATGEELPQRTVKCPSCHHIFQASETTATDPGFTFARVYLWVADIDEDDWEPSFKSTVESILGPCVEIIAWDT